MCTELNLVGLMCQSVTGLVSTWCWELQGCAVPTKGTIHSEKMTFSPSWM